jgi:quercetin dioxygenase-like cupin family protein
MRKTTGLAALAFLAVTLAPGQEPTPSKTPPHVILNESEIQWGDAPPSLPAGAKMAVLQGDPSKGGVYTVRLKAKDGYKIPAHYHPTRENITVISGTFYIGMGDKLDEAQGTAVAAGGLTSMPAQMHHYAWFKGDTEIQIHGVGPFMITYVNPKDDPRKGGKK